MSHLGNDFSTFRSGVTAVSVKKSGWRIKKSSPFPPVGVPSASNSPSALSARFARGLDKMWNTLCAWKMQSANASGRWKSGRNCEGQWLEHDEDRIFTWKTVVDLFLEAFSCYLSYASSRCNSGCRKVPCWGGCWGCRLKSVRVCVCVEPKCAQSI